MKLIITRHGRTEENLQNIIQGHMPGKLTKQGIEQAKKLAQRLKDEKIDYIYSSDLARAADTTKEIIKFHSNTPIEFVKELREQDAGKLTGEKEVLGVYKEPKGGENHKQLQNRARKFLDKMVQKHKNDTILFVTHGGFFKALLSVITNKHYDEILNIECPSNTSINIFEIDEDKNHKIHLFNCTKHLI